jgi:hypothetical protein
LALRCSKRYCLSMMARPPSCPSRWAIWARGARRH